MTDAARRERLATIACGVIRQAVEDARATAVIVLESGTPEGRLATDWATRGLGAARVLALTPEVLKTVGLDPASLAACGLPVGEGERAAARVLAERRDALLAHPANRTVLLLSAIPPEPLLPLGDLPASQVALLAGGWSGPGEMQALVRRAGGIDAVDGFLEALFDRRQRRERALANVPAQVRAELSAALERGRTERRRVGLVPKLGPRTLGIDLFE